MQDIPNFIPAIEYLCNLNKTDYAVALYMLSYIDNDFDTMINGLINYVPTEIYDKIISMELYHTKKNNPELFTKYCDYWINGIPSVQEASEKYANNIYFIIDLFKKNKLTIDFFDYENLDNYNIHEDNMANPEDFSGYDSDDWAEYDQDSQFEEIVGILLKVINS